MHSSAVVVVAAMGIAGALAGPTHANIHHRALHKKDVDYSKAANWDQMDWEHMGIDWASVVKGGGASKSSSTPAPSNAPAAPVASQSSNSQSSASSSPSSSSSLEGGLGDLFGSISELWHQLEGVSNTRTSFGQQTAPSGNEVSYIGNHGMPYGSNAMLVDSTSGYDYTITVKNTQSKPISVNMWNKCGADGQANSGATSAPKTTTLTMALNPGESKIIALDENSQVALCEATDNIHSSGAYATTWAEINMVSTGPAYDVSAILLASGTYKMSITAEECSCESSETQNSWVTESQTIGSGDCWINGKSAHLTVALGGL